MQDFRILSYQLSQKLTVLECEAISGGRSGGTTMCADGSYTHRGGWDLGVDASSDF